jgi:hypothetical protein
VDRVRRLVHPPPPYHFQKRKNHPAGYTEDRAEVWFRALPINAGTRIKGKPTRMPSENTIVTCGKKNATDGSKSIRKNLKQVRF